MPLDELATAQLERLADTLGSLSKDGPAAAAHLRWWALSVLQSGFHGTATVPNAWSAVAAVGAAVPNLLAKDIAAAEEDAAGQDPHAKLALWVHLALQSGSLSHLLHAFPSYSQVTHAYNTNAAVRNKQFMQQAAAKLRDAQDSISEHLWTLPPPDLVPPTAASPDTLAPPSASHDPAGTPNASPDTQSATAPATQGVGVFNADVSSSGSRTDIIDGAIERQDNSAGVGEDSAPTGLVIETEEDAVRRRAAATDTAVTAGTAQTEALAGVSATARSWVGVGARLTMDYAWQGLSAVRWLGAGSRSSAVKDTQQQAAGEAPDTVQVTLTVVEEKQVEGDQGAPGQEQGRQGIADGSRETGCTGQTAGQQQEPPEQTSDRNVAVHSGATGQSTGTVCSTGAGGTAVRVRVALSVQGAEQPKQTQQQASASTAVLPAEQPSAVTGEAQADNSVPAATSDVNGSAQDTTRAASSTAQAPPASTDNATVTDTPPSPSALPTTNATTSTASNQQSGSRVSSWMRGTATSTATVAASAASVLTSIPWRSATTAALGSVTYAASAVVGRGKSGPGAQATDTGTTEPPSPSGSPAVAAAEAPAAAHGEGTSITPGILNGNFGHSQPPSGALRLDNPTPQTSMGAASSLAGPTQPSHPAGPPGVVGVGATSAPPLPGSLEVGSEAGEDDDFDVLEDMREVLEGSAGLVGYTARAPVPAVPPPPKQLTASASSSTLQPVHSDIGGVQSAGVGRGPRGASGSSAEVPSHSSGAGTSTAAIPNITLFPPSSVSLGNQGTDPGAASGESGPAAACSTQQPPTVVSAVVTGHRQLQDQHGESYTAYCFEVQDSTGRRWKVWRRFSEFVLLKKGLVSLPHQHQNPHSGLPGMLAARTSIGSQHSCNSSPTSSSRQQHSSSCSSSSGAAAAPSGLPTQQQSSAGASTVFPGQLVLGGCWDEVSQGRGVLGRARLQADVILSREALLTRCLAQLLVDNPQPWPQDLQQLMTRFLAVPAQAPAAPSIDVHRGAPRQPRSLQASLVLEGRDMSSAGGMWQSECVGGRVVDVAPLSRSVGDLTSLDPTVRSTGHSGAELASTTQSALGSANCASSGSSGSTVSGAQGPGVNALPGMSAGSDDAAARPESQAALQSSPQPSSQQQPVPQSAHHHHHTSSCGSELSMTVRLIVDPHPEVTDAELLRRQSGECAGCRVPLGPLGTEAGGSRGWLMGRARSGPGASNARRCWYTCRLYCPACHKGDTHFIPAAVVHHWDVTPRPVCGAAAEYLAAVKDQPLLCVPALNPALYARVPALATAAATRRRIAEQLEQAEAAGGALADRAKSIRASAGVRGYLLAPRMSDWWALSDLVDLSLGAFAKMPAWLERTGRQAAALAAAVGPQPGTTQ